MLVDIKPIKKEISFTTQIKMFDEFYTEKWINMI